MSIPSTARRLPVCAAIALALAGPHPAFAQSDDAADGAGGDAPTDGKVAADTASTTAPSEVANLTDPTGVTIEEDQRVGASFEVTLGELPAPYTGPAVRNSPVTLPIEERTVNLPDGFRATLYAQGLEHPRQATVLPNGDVLVAQQVPGHLTLLRDDDGDGVAEWNERHAAQFNLPYGVAYRVRGEGDSAEEQILVADQDGIWIVGYEEGLVRPPFAQPVPATEVPEDERVPGQYMDGQTMLTEKGVFGIVQGHVNRDIAITPDGRLYVGVGTSGNIGVEPEPKATIQSFSIDGMDQRTFASGMRNPSGLAVQPSTGDLWALVQERDGTGDDLVPDFFTRVVERGFYGFPYSYIGSNPQPGFAQLEPELVDEAIVPDVLFQPHSAAMDAEFYDGEMFPERFRGGAFVALKGSWNRTQPTGYKVVFVPFDGDSPSGGYENFMTGFWASGDDKAEVWGRPADVAVAPDGALFVVDDTGGTIWRIAHDGDAGS